MLQASSLRMPGPASRSTIDPQLRLQSLKKTDMIIPNRWLRILSTYMHTYFQFSRWLKEGPGPLECERERATLHLARA